MNLDIINKLAAQEQAEKQQEFIAPFSGNGRIKLRLCSVVREYPIVFKKKKTPREGFGIFRIVEDVAVYQEAATLSMIVNYCRLLPRAHFVLLDQVDGQWQALQLSMGTKGLATTGIVMLRGVDRETQFDCVAAAFDGQNFWKYGPGLSRPKVVAARLRDELLKMTEPEKIRISGLLPAELMAYQACWFVRKPKTAYDPDSTLSESERIELALSLAGATLQSVSALNATTATVRFQRGHAQHSVTVNRKTLEVVSSGICLSGRDRDFDLTSLVGVFNEKDRQEEERDPWDD